MQSVISVVFVQKMVQQVIFSHKLTNIALIVTFNYQSDLTDYSVLIIYLIADMNIWISMENRNTYINLQYVILILATILKVIATDNLNDNIFMILVVGVYLLTLIPFQGQSIGNPPIGQLPETYRAPVSLNLPQQDSPDLPESFQPDPSIPFKKSNTSIEFSCRPIQQSEQISIDFIQSSHDKLWRQRLMGIPVGILLIGKFDRKFTYKNYYLESLLSKTLNIPQLEQRNFLLNLLRFRIIDQSADQKRSNFSHFISLRQSKGLIQDPPRSVSMSMHTTRKRRMESSRIISEVETHNPAKIYSLHQVFIKLQEGYFDQLLNEEDRTLEMFCKYQSGDTATHLNVKVLYAPEQVEMTVIVQDYSRYNKLQKIEEQDEFKTKMINSFSHELRTPLNSASLFFKGALLDIQLNEEVKQKFILPGLACLMRQSHLINDIIDFSQINTDVLELRRTQFTLQELLQDLSQIFKFEYSMKNIGLAFKVEDTTPDEIKSDYQRLVQIMVNVLQNALKFSERGYVVVNIKGEGNLLRFHIIDEGSGIANKKLNHIQNILKDYHQQLQGWHGFGLIISQMLLRYLGPVNENNLIIVSPGQGLGTSVKFTIINYLIDCSLPEKRSHRFLSVPILHPNKGLIISIKSKTQSRLLLSQIEDNKTIDVFMKNTNKQLHFVTELNQKYGAGWINQMEIMNRSNSIQHCICKTILSVDDEIFNQISLTNILQKLNYEVEIAYNGMQAISMIENKVPCGQVCNKYALILMDCQMPVMDGWQTTRVLIQKFQSFELRYIPIVGFTAFTGKKDIDMCRQVGMIEVLNKPLQLKKFKQLMDKLNIF